MKYTDLLEKEILISTKNFMITPNQHQIYDVLDCLLDAGIKAVLDEYKGKNIIIPIKDREQAFKLFKKNRFKIEE